MLYTEDKENQINDCDVMKKVAEMELSSIHSGTSVAILIKDAWERSHIIWCKQSISYFRALIASLVKVYSGDADVRDLNDSFALSIAIKNVSNHVNLAFLLPFPFNCT
jgi:hypothetical protein